MSEFEFTVLDELTEDQIIEDENSEEPVHSAFQEDAFAGELLASTDDILIGVPFIVEIRKPDTTSYKDCYYVCSRCSLKVKYELLIPHLESFPHIFKTIEKIIPEVYSKYKDYIRWTTAEQENVISEVSNFTTNNELGSGRLAIADESERKNTIKFLKQLSVEDYVKLCRSSSKSDNNLSEKSSEVQATSSTMTVKDSSDKNNDNNQDKYNDNNQDKNNDNNQDKNVPKADGKSRGGYSSSKGEHFEEIIWIPQDDYPSIRFIPRFIGAKWDRFHRLEENFKIKMTFRGNALNGKVKGSRSANLTDAENKGRLCVAIKGDNKLNISLATYEIKKLMTEFIVKDTGIEPKRPIRSNSDDLRLNKRSESGDGNEDLRNTLDRRGVKKHDVKDEIFNEQMALNTLASATVNKYINLPAERFDYSQKHPQSYSDQDYYQQNPQSHPAQDCYPDHPQSHPDYYPELKLFTDEYKIRAKMTGQQLDSMTVLTDFQTYFNKNFMNKDKIDPIYPNVSGYSNYTNSAVPYKDQTKPTNEKRAADKSKKHISPWENPLIPEILEQTKDIISGYLPYSKSITGQIFNENKMIESSMRMQLQDYHQSTKYLVDRPIEMYNESQMSNPHEKVPSFRKTDPVKAYGSFAISSDSNNKTSTRSKSPQRSKASRPRSSRWESNQSTKRRRSSPVKRSRDRSSERSRKRSPNRRRSHLNSPMRSSNRDSENSRKSGGLLRNSGSISNNVSRNARRDAPLQNNSLQTSDGLPAVDGSASSNEYMKFSGLGDTALQGISGNVLMANIKERMNRSNLGVHDSYTNSLDKKMYERLTSQGIASDNGRIDRNLEVDPFSTPDIRPNMDNYSRRSPQRDLMLRTNYNNTNNKSVRDDFDNQQFMGSSRNDKRSQSDIQSLYNRNDSNAQKNNFRNQETTNSQSQLLSHQNPSIHQTNNLDNQSRSFNYDLQSRNSALTGNEQQQNQDRFGVAQQQNHHDQHRDRLDQSQNQNSFGQQQNQQQNQNRFDNHQQQDSFNHQQNFSRFDQQKTVGSFDQQKNVGSFNQQQNLGHMDEQHNLGRMDQQQSLGRTDQQQNLGRTDQHKNFGRTDKHKNFGRSDQQQNFGHTDQQQNFGRTDQLQNLGRTDQLQNLGRTNQQQNLGRTDLRLNLGHTDQQNFGRMDQEHNNKNHFDQQQQPGTSSFDNFSKFNVMSVDALKNLSATELRQMMK